MACPASWLPDRRTLSKKLALAKFPALHLFEERHHARTLSTMATIAREPAARAKRRPPVAVRALRRLFGTVGPLAPRLMGRLAFRLWSGRRDERSGPLRLRSFPRLRRSRSLRGGRTWLRTAGARVLPYFLCMAGTVAPRNSLPLWSLSCQRVTG